ncbi:MFS transporter [Pseudactinotalea sp. Z1748]|uniref:MFS transporter n=1 Tax=Pseudactinotalea sp. Z1748 TaxID=3413027 RepID=UPI003C7C49CC
MSTPTSDSKLTIGTGHRGSGGTAQAAPAGHQLDRLLTPAFVCLGLADLAYFTASGVAIYALPLYVTGPVGSTPGGAGLAFGAFAVSAILLRPLAGRWSDRYGRAPLLIGGALLAALTLVGMTVADNLLTVVLLRLLFGVAEAAFFVASLAALADLAPPSRMGEAISYNSLGLYLGLGLGAPLGEVVVRTLGFGGAWVVAAILCVGGAALAATIGETRVPRAPTAEPPSGLIHWPAVPIALGFFASVAAMGGFLAFAPLRADGAGLANASMPIFVYGLVVVALRVALARAQDKLPPLTVAAIALATMTLGLSVIVVSTTPLGLVTGTVVLGAGVALSTPAFFAAIFATATPATRGAAAGTASIRLDLGIGLGPIVLGLVAHYGGLSRAFVVAAVIALLGSVWTCWLRLAHRGRTGVTPVRP